MILGLDLDGVTAEYVDGLRTFVARRHGFSPEDIARHLPEVEDYGFSDWSGFGEDFFTYHTQAVEEGLYRGISPLEGASKTLWKLSDEGHHIRVITKRFVKNGQHGRVVADTAAWLEEFGIPYRDLAFLSKKTDLFADVYIDDAPSNIELFKKEWKDHIIFDAPYNRHLKGDRAHNWSELYDLIQDRVTIENTRRQD